MRIPEPQESRTHPLSCLFADARERRRQRYAAYDAASAAPKRCAVVTMVHNEAAFLPIWLGYYSRFFAPDDIHVLDNESTDGSTAGEGFVRIPVEHDSVDHTWMVRTIEAYQHELMDRYDTVLVTDVDEIVAPDPRWGTLRDYVDRMDEPWVNCLGYELLHLRDREPPLRSDRPVLAQRGHWFANDGYDKPAIAMEPMSWKPGFHHRTDNHFNLDPDLRLIHLHRMDYGICLARHRLRRVRAWNPDDLDLGWATHNLITDDEDFERWFYTESGSIGVKLVLERIPETWRRLL